MSIRSFAFFITFWLWLLGISSVSAAVTYTPGPTASLTGSNGAVYFDVGDDIIDAATTVGAPILSTASRTFSGAFYLSGAGWVDFSTGSYRVELDCGAQSLSNLSANCVLSGTGYGELIGDIVFDRRVIYHPGTGLLSGMAGTWLWDYDFSGIALPLRPAEFVQWDIVSADHASILTISGASQYAGMSAWILYFQPTAGTDIAYTLPIAIDLSHASMYRARIIDPDGGVTVRTDFRVQSRLPSATLDGTIASTVRQAFCSATPLACIDGSTLSPTRLMQAPTGPVVANGMDTYDFTLKVRDRYGNRVDRGEIALEYEDRIRTIQASNPPYGNALLESCLLGPFCALLTSDITNNFIGALSTGTLPVTLGDISYTIASRAPTSPIDTLSLRSVLYIDTTGMTTDISLPAWKAPLTFTPWYTTSLTAAMPIVVGDAVDFTTSYTHTTSAPAPVDPSALYDIRIGAQNFASFDAFSSADPISCTKYTSQIGTDECNWSWLPDPVIISTEAAAFQALYSYDGYDPPPPESVSYASYITYMLWGFHVLYPSGAWVLGMATAGDVPLKILGQQNVSKISGIDPSQTTEIYNILRKNTTLLSRNRTSYADTNYLITTGDITLTSVDFLSPNPKKRTIITRGGDITLSTNITGSTLPLAIIALADADGVGGSIHIEPSVTDIEATLFAEKSVFSTGSNQLYIRGSVISRNSVSDTQCPYYVSPCVDAKKYNLQNLRRDFLLTPGTLSTLLAGKHSTIPVIIEYDGRILSDPPPVLEK